MKGCLAGMVLLLVVLSLVITIFYHVSVNSELRFEPRDANAEYINTRRSYRPQIKREDDKQQGANKQDQTPALLDDETAEEVTP